MLFREQELNLFASEGYKGVVAHDMEHRLIRGCDMHWLTVYVVPCYHFIDIIKPGQVVASLE